ncbi:toprim domain-containing protein [Fodinisporobacter ferrooxydans]|uniref:Toprim domain-containing protein n=1 Tax=Fodinisporobacter ferrooxydans TaxID=2901836 RepID=A0ABY4CMB5_9BACL|nr:toprim domain-containing protein [Alicyclobacillaceae bacterium MYW30-H2]
MIDSKVLIVEGKTDKERLQKIIDEPVCFICTFGTLSEEKIEQLIVPLHDEDVYIFVDADDSGNALRSRLKQELPNARHLYTRRVYREVAKTPLSYLAEILWKAHFVVHEEYLSGEMTEF